MKKSCSSHDIAIKSFFLGPKSENGDWFHQEVRHILNGWFQWRKNIYADDRPNISPSDLVSPEFLNKRKQVHKQTKLLLNKFKNEISQFSPRYVGHMYSEISIPALLGHFIAMLHNPNIISSEASKVGAFIENEAIKDLAKMLGFKNKSSTGHFTSGGTVANFEALWRAKYRAECFLSLGSFLNQHHGFQWNYFNAAHMGFAEFNRLIRHYKIKESELLKHNISHIGPWAASALFNQTFKKPFQGFHILVPQSKHYSWIKATSILGMGDISFKSVELNDKAELDSIDLQKKIQKSQEADIPIAMIVSIAGTTELGVCDPIDKINQIIQKMKKNRQHIWHHVDAAYGGYFCTYPSKLKQTTTQKLRAIANVDSVTLDPHKLGYIPYSCGAFIASNTQNYATKNFSASYIQSPAKNIDRWLSTIEGSRSATGATATWLANKCIGLNSDGYGRVLEKTISAKTELKKGLKKNSHFIEVPSGDFNVICIFYLDASKKLSECNRKTQKLVTKINVRNKITVSQTELHMQHYKNLIHRIVKNNQIIHDTDQVFVLRMTLMNPFLTTQEVNKSYIQEILEELNKCV